MKKTLLFFIILLVITLLSTDDLISAYIPNGFNCSYHTYNEDSTLNLDYDYLFRYDKNWVASHNGTYVENINNKFDKESRVSDLYWILTNNRNNYTSNIHFDYNYSFDKGAPDNQLYSIKQRRKAVGFGLTFSPFYGFTDSLIVKTDVSYLHNREKDRKLEDSFILSNGFKNQTEIYMFRQLDTGRIYFNTFFELRDLDYEWKRRYGSYASWLWNWRVHSVNSFVTFEENRNQIYSLQTREDIQYRRIYQGIIDYKFRLFDRFQLKLSELYLFHKNTMEVKTSKNYTKKENIIRFATSYRYKNYSFFVNAEREFQKKTFEEVENAEESDNKVFTSGVGFHFSPRDSLVIKRTLQLTRNDYPNADVPIDNDKLSNSYQFSLYSYIKDNIRVTTHFHILKDHNVYLYSNMSGNNNKKTSYHLQPALDVFIGKNYLFRQKYLLRADYDEYDYEKIGDDILFRKLSMMFSLIYDSKEYILYEKSENSLSNSDFSDYSFQYELSYKYDTYNSGNIIDDLYEITLENEYHVASLMLKKNWERLSARLRPKVIWSDDIEYNHILGLMYWLNENSNAELIINPNGKNWEDVIWMIDFRMSYYF